MNENKDEAFVQSDEEHDSPFFENPDPQVVDNFHDHHKENIKVHRRSIRGMLSHKPILIGVALLVLGVSSGAWLLMAKDADEPVIQTSVEDRTVLGAAVTLLDGTAQISSDGSNWSSLTKDSDIQEKDWIKTDAASRVIITIDDGSVVRLDESSTLQLTDLTADAILLNNKSGDVYSRVVSSDRTFTVAVDDITYTALGTAFKTVNESETKGVQVYQSSVKVENSQVDEGKQYFQSHTNAELKEKVTDVSVDEMKSDSFMLWNLEQDKQSDFKDKLGYLLKIEEKPVESAPAPAPTTAKITLSATTNEKGVVLKWSVSNIGTVDGFKVVRSKKTTTPTFGKDEANYASGASTRTLTWKDGSGVTYNYRVCAYSGGTCSTYSNTVNITSPYTPPTPVVDGTMTLTMTNKVASWTFTGTAPHGYKLLVSDNAGATYLTADKAIYSSSTSLDISEKLSNTGTYYIRVCAYTSDTSINNGCSNYSNEEIVNVP